MQKVDEYVDRRIIPLMRRKYASKEERKEAEELVRRGVRKKVWDAWWYAKHGGKDPYGPQPKNPRIERRSKDLPF